MVRLCSDRDILKYEPALFGANYLASQVIATGTTGVLAGTTFQATGASFISAQVEAGDCIYLKSADGKLDGIYEIVTVDSATQLCVSVMREDSQGDPIAVPVGTQTTGITYRVSTFRPQIAEVSLRIMEQLGIRQEDNAADEILNTDELRRICAMGVIATAYRTLAEGDNAEILKSKSAEYDRLFSEGLEKCRIFIDKDNDGIADNERYGGCGRLFRD
jgi:hypothetical protein